MINAFLKHLRKRREFNRVKRFMKYRAEGRLTIALYQTGALQAPGCAVRRRA